jgi:hypothetical protein
MGGKLFNDNMGAYVLSELSENIPKDSALSSFGLTGIDKYRDIL